MTHLFLPEHFKLRPWVWRQITWRDYFIARDNGKYSYQKELEYFAFPNHQLLNYSNNSHLRWHICLFVWYPSVNSSSYLFIVVVFCFFCRTVGMSSPWLFIFMVAIDNEIYLTYALFSKINHFKSVYNCKPSTLCDKKGISSAKENC